MRWTFFGILAAYAAAGTVCPAIAQTSSAPEAAVLFTNVRIFDGKSEKLSAASHVLVRGNKIAKISTVPIPTDRLLSGNLTPRLIDCLANHGIEDSILVVGVTPREPALDA